MLPWLLGCAHPRPASPPPLADGAALAHDERLTVWVGSGPPPPPGDALAIALGLPFPARDTPWIAVPDARDLRSARGRRATTAASAGGPGGRAAPWRHVDLVVGDRSLRVVVAPGGGPGVEDALSWLPKVLGPEPTVLIVGEGDRAGDLRALARRHSTSLVLSSWPGDTAIVSAMGRFGELWLQPGPGARLAWSGDELLVTTLDPPIRAVWSPGGGWTVPAP